ncbi:hypothetical protein FRB99_007423 [Tulasnella sp. 403]|nr:hypothetical protein FRB99_007423 [Tulasnella sp. 403]
MSSSQGGDEADDLKPTFAEGFKLGEKKASRLLYTSPATVDQYAQLDANDESLARWKASLGITPGGAVPAGSGPKVTVLSLTLISASLPAGRTISLDLTNSDVVTGLKDKPVTIKEGIEYKLSQQFKTTPPILN